MESTLGLIDLLGAGALLVWGLRQIKSGILSGFGASLRQWIASGTRTRLHAAISGLFVTISMQSSTATAIITASFAGRGLIQAKMAQAIMLGANVGTALVAVTLSLDFHFLAPALILFGVVTSVRSRRARSKGLGKALLGLGLMLFALRFMAQVTEPLRESVVLGDILNGLDGAPIFGFILAAIMATAATSSLAVVLLVAFLTQADMVAPSLAVVLIAGANVGGAVPPCLAVVSEGIAAQRLVISNLSVRLAGGMVVMVFAQTFSELMMRFEVLPSLPLATHLFFNVSLLVLFLPLVGWVSRLMELLLPDKEDPLAEVSYLDESALDTPSLALAGAAREVLRMGDKARDMLEINRNAMLDNVSNSGLSISKLDDSIDAKLQSVKFYLARLRGVALCEPEAQRCNEVMSYAINVEHVGDIIDNYLSVIADKKIKRNVQFSSEGQDELKQFYQITLENIQLAQSVFITRDIELARRLMEAKVYVRKLEEESSNKHMARIDAQRRETMDTSSLHLDILRDLKRINAHLASVAYPVLEEIGALRESRLKDGGGNVRSSEQQIKTKMI